MYISIRVTNEIENDIWAGKANCPACCKITDFQLAKRIRTSHIFSVIPTISATSNRYITCTKCNYGKELSKKEYNNLSKKQYKLLDKGEIPEDYIRTNYISKNLKLVSKTIKLVLSTMLAVFMLFAMVMVFLNSINSETASESEPIAYVMLLIMCVLYVIPFCLTLKNFIPAVKKKIAYSKLSRR